MKSLSSISGVPLPRDVRRAIECMAADPVHAFTVAELARAAGVAPRTLQKHFRRFVGRPPLTYLRDLRFDQVRRELLRAGREATVTAIATRCGFSHLGYFATGYCKRYGESPSATLRRGEIGLGGHAPFPPLAAKGLERPVVAVLPFEMVGEEARFAAAMPEEIATALLRFRWIRISKGANARYRIGGKVRGDPSGRLRVTVILTDASTLNILWADHWEGACAEAFDFEDRVAARVARAIEPALREAEISRARCKDPDLLGAWELSMRALPGVLSYEASAEATALELLERAMNLAPQDPLPMALAAWCRGVRSCLHFTSRPHEERELARQLAVRAAVLSNGDALTEAALGAGYTLAHDLATAAIHVDRALALDGGSAWAWKRSGWIKAFRGEGGKAVERFKIARAIAPTDPLSAMCCFGIAAPLMQADRHGEAIPWIRRGIAECPRTAVWMNPFLAAAYALENRKEEARHSLAEWRRIHPGMTIAQVCSGLPFGAGLFDRVAEGLESAGLRHSA